MATRAARAEEAERRLRDLAKFLEGQVGVLESIAADQADPAERRFYEGRAASYETVVRMLR